MRILEMLRVTSERFSGHPESLITEQAIAEMVMD